MATANPDVWLTEREAAALLGIDPRTLAAEVEAGGGPPAYQIVANARRYKRAEVEEYLRLSVVNRPGGDAA